MQFLLSAFAAHEKQSAHLMAQKLALPAYEQLLKAAHTFNLLDARGAISVTERAAYIERIRNLARAVAHSYLESRARLGFPMAPKACAALSSWFIHWLDWFSPIMNWLYNWDSINLFTVCSR